jgi:hypothetical protein
MRFRSYGYLALSVFAAASPALVRAQFQEPTPDELKMTSDPKAPGAAAVYLYREEEVDDKNHYYSYYERIKVLTEKGKELATITIPYEHGVDSVTDIQGRTIHADGTVVPLTAKPADLMDLKLNKSIQINTVVFTLPAVEVGSILEYRLKVRSPDYRISEPTWEIQQTYFVHKAHYSFHPYLAPGHFVSDANGGQLNWMMFAERIESGVHVVFDSAKDTYNLDLSDIPAIPDEDWMPPLNTLKWRVEFYYTNSKSGPAFWQDAGKRWAKSVEEFTNPNGGLRNAAASLLAPADTDEQKAEKIYAAVMKFENTDFTRKKSEAERKKEKIKEIHKAEDVWKQQTGSADDIALLYVALARAAGLKAYPVQVVDRDRAIFDDRYLSMRQFDDYLALVNLGGKDVYLDPGEKYCPFGRLHWKHTYASGFKLTDQGTVPVTTPANNYKAAVVSRVADLTIDTDGSVKGTVRFVMTGPDALRWRQLTLENDSDEVKKRFNDSMKDEIPDGVQADFDHFLGLDDYSANLIGIVKVSGNIGTATGKRFFLPGMFFESRAKHPFVAEEKRATPIDVHYPMLTEDEVTYHLPAGYTVESAPQAAKNNWPDHAILAVASEASGDAVKIDRTLAYNFTLLGPKDYSDLHGFYQKVATADQQPLVLTRATVAKGN